MRETRSIPEDIHNGKIHENILVYECFWWRKTRLSSRIPVCCVFLFRGGVGVLGGLDVAFEEVLVVLFAGVFHDFPVGTKREDAVVLPGLGVRDGVVDHDLVSYVALISALKAFDN